LREPRMNRICLPSDHLRTDTMADQKGVFCSV
jgi:hypothetical protein